jgi:PilZ domain
MSILPRTRRWTRLPIDMPVKVVTSKGFSSTTVEGRGTELSQGGMELYAGIMLDPGDMLEIEFEMPTPSRMTAIVRSRNGFCFGLEFITPLPS